MINHFLNHRVKSVECGSSNTTLPLTGTKQSPKAKQRKVEESEGQNKQGESKLVAPTVAPKSTRTSIKLVKPLTNSTEAGEITRQSKPSSGMLDE